MLFLHEVSLSAVITKVELWLGGTKNYLEIRARLLNDDYTLSCSCLWSNKENEKQQIKIATNIKF